MSSRLESPLTAAGTPNEFVPVLQTSFWIDAKAAWRSTAFAYGHSAVVFVAAALAFYYLMTLVLGSVGWAAAAAWLWTLLPSTVATAEYLSTRCYLEGFLFSCLALLAQLRSRWLLAGVCALAATLSKEFFPPVLLSAMFLTAAAEKRWRLAAVPVVVGAVYAGLRLSAVGSGLAYGMPFLGPGRFLLLIGKLPYYFSGNWGGYLLAAAGAAALIYLANARRLESRRLVLLLGVCWLLGVATVYPVAFALDASWNGHGVWTRTGFVFNTVALVALIVVAKSLPRRRNAAAIGVLAGLALAHGAWQTARTWSGLKDHYRVEAEFTLDGTDRVLLSTVPASWFFRPFVALYPEAKGRYVIRKDELCQPAYLRIEPPTDDLWVYDHGNMVKNTEGLSALRRGCK